MAGGGVCMAAVLAPSHCLFLCIFGAIDQGELCAPKVSPTVFGVKESKYALRMGWFPVAGELGPVHGGCWVVEARDTTQKIL